MPQKFASAFTLCAFSLIGQLMAQAPSETDETWRPMRVSLQHRDPKGIGYNKGYSSLDLFFAVPEKKNWGIAFLDLRGHIFNNAKYAANAGLGWRYPNESASMVYGINAYYDYRASRKAYHQVSMGLEAIGQCFEFRANGYLPVGDKEKCFSSCTETTPFFFSNFQGHNIFLEKNSTTYSKLEQSMKGADAEAGAHLYTRHDCDFFIGVGPYYFKGEHGKSAWGGKGRITANLTPYLTLEFADSWDTVFHHRPQGMVSVNLPFGPKGKQGRRHLRQRLYQPVEKQEIIVLNNKNQTCCETFREVAINPITNEPYFVVFVDNTSSSDGTFESPYPTLALASDNSKSGDIIYVFPGDGTTKGMDEGIVLKERQKFWGSGVDQILGIQRGLFTIPAHSKLSPQITNLSGNGITPDKDNEISGFTISYPEGGGIVSEGRDLGRLFVTKSKILGAGTEGILLDTDTEIAPAIFLVELEIFNNANAGIQFNSSEGTNPTFVLSDSKVFLNGINNIVSGVVIMPSGTIDALFLKNQINNNGSFGVQIPEDTIPVTSSPVQFYTFLSNTFKSNASAGIRGDFDHSPVKMTLENNSFEANRLGGAIVIFNPDSELDFLCRHNSFTFNGTGEALSVSSSLASEYNAIIEDNLFKGNASAAMHLRPVNKSSISILNNKMEGNALDGVRIDMGHVDMDLEIKNNSILNNPNGSGIGSGIFLNGSGFDNIIRSSIENNIISGNGVNGVLLITLLSPTKPSTFKVASNKVIGNGNAGVVVSVENLSPDPATMTASILDNDISKNGFLGVVFETGSLGTALDLSASLSNNTLNDNRSYGFNVKPSANTKASIFAEKNTFFRNGPSDAGFFAKNDDTTASLCLQLNDNRSDRGYLLDNGIGGNMSLAPLNAQDVNIGPITNVGTVDDVSSCD